MAKKTTLPASTTKKMTPSKPATPGARKPPPSGGAAPAWTQRAAKKAAPKYTPRKSGGK